MKKEMVKANQKKKINLLSNTTKSERDAAEKRIAANKKKAVSKVVTKTKTKSTKLESSKKGNIFTKRTKMINKIAKVN